MSNPQVVALREEYSALVFVANGLLELLREACNPITIARMAQEARDAARKIASAIERLLLEKEEPHAPSKKRGILDVLRGVVDSVRALFG